MKNKDSEISIKVIDTEIQALKDLKDSIVSCVKEDGVLYDMDCAGSDMAESISEALDLMENAKGNVIISGIGKSGIIAKKIVASLASTGTSSFFVHPSEASHGDLGMISKDDVVVAISNSGESKELVDVLNYCKRFDIALIAITKNEESTLAKMANVLLKLPNSKEACPLGLAPTSSTTTTLVLGDLLTVALMERKSFTKEDFNQRHPGGKLGNVLLRVSSMMHTGEDIPLLGEEASMESVLLEMSYKRMGCVGFIDTAGKLSGIFTDGDLRRCISGEILTKKAKDLMTRNPKSVNENVFASEVLKIMNTKKITNIFVTDKENNPVGIVHIHDLLNIGIA